MKSAEDHIHEQLTGFKAEWENGIVRSAMDAFELCIHLVAGVPSCNEILDRVSKAAEWLVRSQRGVDPLRRASPQIHGVILHASTSGE